MCLVALAIERSARFPFVVAANRDEFFVRPSAALDWWSADAHSPAVLGGRDLQGGGTWLGLTRPGRFGLLTNVRDSASNAADAPSRGAIVPLWLRGDLAPEQLRRRNAGLPYNGFNLIAADFERGDFFFASNRGVPLQTLAPGLYGLSNAGLDAAWPKVVDLKARLQEALRDAASLDGLRGALFDALADRRLADDDHLPDTGVPKDWERLLSAAFISAPKRGYGTRCSTLVIAERSAGGSTTHVFERAFEQASPAEDRHVVLSDWPPSRQAR